MEEAAFDPSSYDPSRPAAFYLGDEDLAEYTDSVRVVQGAELPVSAIVVVQRSAVLRGAYRAERESVALQASRPRWAALLLPGFVLPQRPAALPPVCPALR